MNVSNFITIENDELSEREWEKLFKALTFVNDDGQVVESYRQILTRGYTKIPRGAWSLLPNHVRYFDQRSFPERKKFHFTVELDDVEKDPRFAGQSEAVETMFREEQGLIIRPPGTGKTQIALKFAASVGTRTLVVVHTKDILDQWMEYAKEAVPDAKIGRIQGSKCVIGDITIATVQTLRGYVSGEGKQWWRQFGCIMLDEAHHASALTFEAVLNTCPARYRFGFTASETRADGMHPTMKFIIGPVIHKQKFSSSVDLKVIPVHTKFRFRYRGRWDWMSLLDALISDKKRNAQIVRIVNAETDKGNSVLVLSRRIEHLAKIADGIGNGCSILAASGEHRKSTSERRQLLANFRSGGINVVLATQLADEALDVPRLNRVLLVHPGKHDGRIIQQIGRALRKHPDKKDAVIYDFIDWRIGVLRRQWNERKRTYKKNKISIKLLARG